MKIKEIKAREILDSRGNPTVEVDVVTKAGVARAAVPSGASTGIHEALELRDNSKRFLGKGVQKAVCNVNVIAKAIVGKDCTKQKEIDNLMIELDGTRNKLKLGANAILGVSLAVARAGALAQNKKLYEYLGNKKILPVPFCNILNGGKHAGNKLDIQEFMAVPVKARNFREAIRYVAEIYHVLKGIIKKKYGRNAINVGDEGGFAPPLDKTKDALELLTKAIEQAGYNDKIKVAVDAAASGFYKKGKYKIDGKSLDGDKLIDYYKTLIKKYPLISIEDPFSEDDWKNFCKLRKEVKIQIVGDDLLVTNIERVKKAIELKACNSLLLKVNQIGTLTEAINAAKLAMKNKFKVMVSHRSGETEDSFIADLAVGLGYGQIKAGATCRGERISKYNQLIRIEEELGNKAKYGVPTK